MVAKDPESPYVGGRTLKWLEDPSGTRPLSTVRVGEVFEQSVHVCGFLAIIRKMAPGWE
jgi:hypothetical protein